MSMMDMNILQLLMKKEMKSYPAGIPEGEEVELQAFSYVEAEDGTEGDLLPIETDEEWDMIEEVLNTFLDEEEE